MFEQLRKALSSATRNIIHKELTEKDLTKVLSELEIALLQSDIAQEVIDVLVTKLKSELIGTKLEKEQNAANIVQIKFRNAIVEMFSRSGEVDLIKKIIEKKDKRGGPFIVVFLGINGTGKTTTVAKVAHFLRKHNISVVLAAGDTHRAGAIEQISLHAEKLSLKVITQRYGADPSAVGRDAIDYAKKHHIDVVLVDTAGRMQTAKNLMDEINKIVRVVKPDIKLFIGDSLAGNDTINQAREFFEYTKFDGAILTKTDADVKGGSAISIVHATSKPIVLLGMGQSYDDIIPFSSEKFLDSVFGNSPLISKLELQSNNIIQQDITKQNPNREMEIEVPHEDVTLRTLSNEDTSERLIQKIDGTSPRLSSNSPDSGSNKYEALDKAASEKTIIQEQPDQQEAHLKQTQHSEQQQEQKQQQGYQEQQPKFISVTSDKKPESTAEKKEPGSFFRGLFGKKSKNKTQDPEKNFTIDNSTITSSNEKEPTPSLESVGKLKTTDLVKNDEKKVERQKEAKEKEEETVYLTDEDIEDLLK